MSANSNATTTANALNNQLTRNLQNYVQCLHVACLHEYTGTGEELGASQLIEKHEGYIFWVMHPRWCPACLESRKRQLERTFRDRLPKPDLESTEVRRERAYTIGVRNGRIRALSTSFEDCEKFGKKGLDGKSGEEELVERMERLGLASKQDGDEAVGELARLLSKQKLEVDEVGDAINNWYEEQLNYAEGVKEGLLIQGSVEEKALQEDWEDRLEAMRNALL